MSEEEKNDPNEAVKAKFFEELKKRRAYDLALKDLQSEVHEALESYKIAEKTVRQCKNDLKDAKEAREDAQKNYFRASEKLSLMAKSDLEHYQQSLLDFQYDDDDDIAADEEDEDCDNDETNEPVESTAMKNDATSTQCDIETNEEWKTFPADRHFNLTDKEWTTLEQSVPEADLPLTVGKMAELVSSLERGMKLKGFGSGKLEKIKIQFDEFWKSEAYQNSLDPVPHKETEEITSSNETTEESTSDTEAALEEETKPEVAVESKGIEVEPVVPDESKHLYYIKLIESLLSEDRFSFAEENLLGILEWIKENQHVTERQIESINNIKNSVEEREDCFE